MNRWLLWKELRENAAIAALGLVACLVVAGSLANLPLIGSVSSINGPSRMIPFVHPSWLFNFWVVAVALAAALGLRQTAWEDFQATYRFLLHRPLSRPRLFAHKLAVGSGLLLAAVGLPLAFLAAWAATPGTHASPFRASMLIPTVQMILALMAIYLGAFISGLRPARWVYTRMLPLVAVGALFIVQQIFTHLWLTWLLAWGATLILLVAVVVNLALSRDYA